MSEAYCQSCGMPLGEDGEMRGSEADGSPSRDYCKYCYEKGRFLADCTMEEMIDFCVPLMAQSGMDAGQARRQMETVFPQLKRWKRD
ncbi:zinc ribbon domain-containing protein [bacterium 210820-DFI.6.52]|nr:zinc ribbon domain-containing protein [bacterium 210820-DFI.6.52]